MITDDGVRTRAKRSASRSRDPQPGEQSLTSVSNRREATVVIVDDDPGVREALLGLLDDDSRLHVVGTADSGPAGAELCAQHHPTLAIVDVMMPGGGEEAIESIHRVSASTQVVVYTAKSDRRTRQRMLAAGAVALFVKGGGADLGQELAALSDASRHRPAVPEAPVDDPTGRSPATGRGTGGTTD
jgi:DNA-binding NarL/FixJ family response regulator